MRIPFVDPETHAEQFGIGVGAHGEAPFIVDNPFAGKQRRMVPVEIDEEMLSSVASMTGGKYFRATNNQALREIYEEIGELEKTKIEERMYTDYSERYTGFLLAGLGLILLEILLSTTILRRFP